MMLRLDSDKMIKKFYRLLPLYKSILFKYVYFQLQSKDSELSLIVKGLNNKNR